MARLAVFDLTPREEGARVAAKPLLLEHESTRKRLPLHDGLSIGRKNCHHTFPDDSVMSRQHCKFEMLPDGGFACVDLNSTNRTRVNDREVRPDRPVRIKPGDRLEVGNQFFKAVDPEKEPAPKRQPEPQGQAMPKKEIAPAPGSKSFNMKKLVLTALMAPVGLIVAAFILGLAAGFVRHLSTHVSDRMAVRLEHSLEESCFNAKLKSKDRCATTLHRIASASPQAQERLLARIPNEKAQILKKIIATERGTTLAMETSEQ